MKRIIVASLLLAAFPAFAGEGIHVRLDHLYKNYNGSVVKSSARESRLQVNKTFSGWRLGAGYQYAAMNRYQPRNLRVDKFHLSGGFKVNPDTDWPLSYLTIDDNLAPTDGGNIYGTTLVYRGLAPTLSLRASYHYSDYDGFSVSQIKAGLVRKIPLDGMGLSIAVGTGYQHLDDKESVAYIASANSHYLAPYLRVRLQRGPWRAGLGFAGRRLFEVGDEGRRVSHHAMELRRSVAAMVGRQFGRLSISFAVSHHEAEELPQSNRLQLNTLGASLDYRF